MNARLIDIKKALESVLLKVTTESGKSLTIKAENIYKRFNRKAISQSKDIDYPKLFVVLDRGTTDRLPSRNNTEHVNFLIIAVLKDLNNADDPVEDKMLVLIEDLKDTLAQNDTLENTVIEATVEGFTTDSGNAFPEALAALRIAVEYQIMR